MSDRQSFTESSGSVFADLGLLDAEIRLAKAELARKISMTIQEKHLTQREAAEILEIDQPKVSAITRGRLADFSLDRLLTLANRMGMNIEIIVSANPEPTRSPRIVVHGAEEAVVANASGSRERARFE